MSIVNICVHCKTKTKQNFADLKKKFVDFQNFQKSNFVRGHFWKFDHTQTFPRDTRGPTKNLDPIGSAVLTCIGYKQANKQTDKQSIYILGF